jgi:hypothetical protein
LIKDTSSKLGGTIDYDSYYVKDVLILTKRTETEFGLEYVLGLLNSKLMRYYYETSFPTIHVQNKELGSLPFKSIDFANTKEKIKHDEIVNYVEQMLESKKKLATAKTEAEANRLEMLCAGIDRKIDEAVYELYGLTEEEIRIVEQ